MYRLALLIISVVFTGSIIFAARQNWLSPDQEGGNEQILSSTTDFTQTVSAFETLKEPLFFEPIALELAGKTLDVEKIGLQEDGFLEVPSSWDKAGWYSEGAKPGQIGNVIVDGHYDDDKGKPAAFWDLKTLSVNDKVVLKDGTGRALAYKVLDIFYVDIEDSERTDIFAEVGSDRAGLTLVTCGGVWDAGAGTYSKRLVVKAELDSVVLAGR